MVCDICSHLESQLAMALFLPHAGQVRGEAEKNHWTNPIYWNPPLQSSTFLPSPSCDWRNVIHIWTPSPLSYHCGLCSLHPRICSPLSLIPSLSPRTRRRPPPCSSSAASSPQTAWGGPTSGWNTPRLCGGWFQTLGCFVPPVLPCSSPASVWNSPRCLLFSPRCRPRQ